MVLVARTVEAVSTILKMELLEVVLVLWCCGVVGAQIEYPYQGRLQIDSFMTIYLSLHTIFIFLCSWIFFLFFFADLAYFPALSLLFFLVDYKITSGVFLMILLEILDGKCGNIILYIYLVGFKCKATSDCIYFYIFIFIFLFIDIQEENKCSNDL